MTTPNNNRIDQTSSTSPVRQSTNFSVERQTPKTEFGDRVKYGLESAAGAVTMLLMLIVFTGVYFWVYRRTEESLS